MQKNKKEKAKEFHENLKKKFSKRKTCRGGKEHDWLLTIPEWYIDRAGKVTQEMITGYYKIRKREENFNKEIENDFQRLGMTRRKYGLIFRRGNICKHYICSVCGKREYKHN